MGSGDGCHTAELRKLSDEVVVVLSTSLSSRFRGSTIGLYRVYWHYIGVI